MRLADLIGATMGEPDQDSRDLTKALFEAAYDGCTTKRQKAEAARKVMFGMAICRELVGDELADKLGVRRRTVRFVMPMMKRFVAAVGGFTLASAGPAFALVMIGSVIAGWVFAQGMNLVMQRVNDPSSSVILQFVSTFGITTAYVWYANSRLDPAARKIRDSFEGKTR